MTKADIIDPAVADAAFALKEGEVSAPVKGRFGTVLRAGRQDRAGHARSRSRRSPPRSSASIADRARQGRDLSDLHDKIEDERAGGATLAEDRQEARSSQSRTIEAVDRSGRDPDGKPVADLPQDAGRARRRLHHRRRRRERPAAMPSGGYVWYDVAGITPSRDRTLDEVKDQVEARWRDDEIADAAQGQGRRHARQAQGRHRARRGRRGRQAQGRDRQPASSAASRAGFVPADVVDAVFRPPRSAPAAPRATTPTERVVFRVTDVIDAAARCRIRRKPSSIDDDAASARSPTISSAQYIARLENDLGVTHQPGRAEPGDRRRHRQQ